VQPLHRHFVPSNVLASKPSVRPSRRTSTAATGVVAEVESGKHSDRPALDKALAAARVRQVPLVFAKLDRLTRFVAFLTRLLEVGVDVRFADLPMIQGATGKFLLQQMAVVASWKPKRVPAAAAAGPGFP
jgi:DNA invertase Pin-like site-specific DNA recombinase